MRKLIFIALIIVMVLLSGFFVVNERQNVVITRFDGKQIVKQHGIHFALPIIEKVSYAYINERNALLSLAINLPNEKGSTLQVELLTNYHVINPKVYVQYRQKQGKGQMNKKMADFLSNKIVKQLEVESLSQFNQQDILLNSSSQFAEFGVSLDKVYIVNIRLAKNENNTQPVLSNESKSEYINIESAYYDAQITKTNAQLEVDKINQSMQIKDPKFYEYYTKLKTYEQTAKTVDEVPPLSALYSN